eukprot:Anaeramoba_flamelloidesa88286_151.p1 GENE.a88286_151~~a88286_151.p1  ORF type:complete len:268 (+),score=93.17 a88286_151:33-836(+)
MNSKHRTQISSIAKTFLQIFFKRLNEEPQTLYEFFEPNSLLSIGEEGEIDFPTRGVKNIRSKLDSQKYVQCQIDFSDIVYQDCGNGSIVICLIGWIANKGEAPQKFTRTFILESNNQEGFFFIRNDIMRFIKDDFNRVSGEYRSKRQKKHQSASDHEQNLSGFQKKDGSLNEEEDGSENENTESEEEEHYSNIEEDSQEYYEENSDDEEESEEEDDEDEEEEEEEEEEEIENKQQNKTLSKYENLSFESNKSKKKNSWIALFEKRHN